MVLPEIPGSVGELTLRGWRPEDVTGLLAARAVNDAHLRPWMSWANEPLPDRLETLLQMATWAEKRRAGGDAVYGIFLAGQVAGGCGLHHTLGPDGLEIGYWVHVDHLRRGVASTAAALLTDTAFSDPRITHVEIHHDLANAASEGVPRTLGFTLVGESADPPQAPGEVGIERRWRMTRAQWPTARTLGDHGRHGHRDQHHPGEGSPSPRA